MYKFLLLLLIILVHQFAKAQGNESRYEENIFTTVYSDALAEPNFYVYAEFKAKGRKSSDLVDIKTRLAIKDVFTGKTVKEGTISYTKEIKDSTYFEFRGSVQFQNVLYLSRIKKIIIVDQLANAFRILLMDAGTMTPIDTLLLERKQSFISIHAFDKYAVIDNTLDAGLPLYEIASKFIKRDSIHLSYPYFKPDGYARRREPSIAAVLYSGPENKPLLINTYVDGNFAFYRRKSLLRNEWELLDTASYSTRVSYDKPTNSIYYFKVKDSFYSLWKYDLSTGVKRELAPQFLSRDYQIDLFLKTESRNNFLLKYSDRYSYDSRTYVQKYAHQSNVNKSHPIEINLETMNKFTFSDEYIFTNQVFLRHDTVYWPETRYRPPPEMVDSSQRLDWDSLHTIVLKGDAIAGKKMPELQLPELVSDTIYYAEDNPYVRLSGRINNKFTSKNYLYINGRSVFAISDFAEIIDVNTCPDNEILVECFDEFDNYNSRLFHVVKQQPKGTEGEFLKMLNNSKNIALIIAEKEYEHKPDTLTNTIKEAARLKDLLASKYNFDERNIYVRNNLKRSQVIKTLDTLSRNAGEYDQVLIFYTGHGIYDSVADRGFWIPIDGTKEDQSNWYSNDDLVGIIKKIKSKHIFLLVDACYSGSILEGKYKDPTDKVLPFASLFPRKSRQALTSGSIEKVPDKSAFMEAIIRQLESNTKQYYRVSDLFNDIKDYVLSNTRTSPQYGIIRDTGSDGGEFFFIKK